jgi:hypothetical protein
MSTSRPAPTGTQPTSSRRDPMPAPRNVRRRVTIHRVHPWSVLKLSLIFYFCMLLVVMAGLAMFWSIVIRVGVIQALQEEADKFGAAVQVNGGNLARLVFLIGLVNVVLWSAINVFMAFLYNLIADLVGGFRITMSDDDASR